MTKVHRFRLGRDFRRVTSTRLGFGMHLAFSDYRSSEPTISLDRLAKEKAMKRMSLAVVTAIVLSVGVGSVAQAAPHGGHRSHGGAQRSSFGVHTPRFSFDYGYGGHGGRGYSGHGGHGYGGGAHGYGGYGYGDGGHGYGGHGYGGQGGHGGRYQSGQGHSGHNGHYSW